MKNSTQLNSTQLNSTQLHGSVKPPLKSGFTLVELAIVIVIIGLIVSAVLGAQSLINSAKIQSQIKQFKNLELATNAFKLEYDAKPGDFDKDECEAYGWNTSYMPYTCKYGNGNGNLEGLAPHTCWNCPGPGGTASYPNRVWNGETGGFYSHLAAADILNESLTPWHGTGYTVLGEDVLRGKINDKTGLVPATMPDGNLIFFLGPFTSQSSTVPGHSLHFQLGNFGENSTSNIIPPKTAKSLDRKMDDGKPNTGIIKAAIFHSNSYPHFLDSDDSSSSDVYCAQDGMNVSTNINKYDLTEENCRIMFITNVR
jgi:prepilin-type N-terminal cleavage/methylation domain-containing protein